ncbi:MAG: tol-pal system-associated acyl-CoA thioesterase [Rhodospirillaceae bacterium]|jgi:acyl-CoA thioester hydrolase|nr:tol-pal system-associated acyl-CoA thioesterase [Rhodospirillaceae bacterium]
MNDLTRATRPATHRQTIRVYFEDTDAAGIVYYANYLKFAERARTDWLRALGMPHSQMIKRDGLTLVVRRCEADYRKPAHLDDELVVETELTKLGGASIDLLQRVFRDGDLLVEMKVVIVCVGRDGKAARLPDYLRAALPRINHVGA